MGKRRIRNRAVSGVGCIVLNSADPVNPRQKPKAVTHLGIDASATFVI